VGRVPLSSQWHFSRKAGSAAQFSVLQSSRAATALSDRSPLSKSRNLANKDVDSVSPELLARRGGLLATIHGGNTLATQVGSGPSHVPSDLLRGWRRISVPEMAEGLKPQWAPRSSGFPWTSMWRLVSAERPHDGVDTYLRYARP
jgi:hypothetical protein